MENEKSNTVNKLKDDLASLKLLEKKALENIEAWDPVKYRTKREGLVKSLEEGLRKEIQKKEVALQQLGASSFVKEETDVMVWFRYVALIWNVVLSHFLGRTIRREEVFLCDRLQKFTGEFCKRF